MELTNISFLKMDRLKYLLPITIKPILVKMERDKSYHHNKAVIFSPKNHN